MMSSNVGGAARLAMAAESIWDEDVAIGSDTMTVSLLTSWDQDLLGVAILGELSIAYKAASDGGMRVEV